MTPQQLKNSILQLAIQGKLVPQDPSDEPASVLVDRIREEKARLVREKKIKKDKNSSFIYRGSDKSFYEVRNGAAPVCIDDQLPFDIPDSWTWARLGSIVQILNGDRGKNYPAKSSLQKSGRIPFISAINIDEYTVRQDNLLYLSEQQFSSLRAGKLVKGDIVLCIRGSLGKVCIYPYDVGAIASSLAIIRPLQGVFPLYIVLYIACPLFKVEMRKYENGTAQPNLAAQCLEEMLFPIPPSKEQLQIIAKLAEIRPELEKYEKSWDELELLSKSIPSNLRQSILQEAIQGKLVPQLPEEGTAQDLLIQIRAEKEQLVREGKLKPSVLATPSIERRGNSYYENGRCIDDELPFGIPDSWAWVRLSAIARISTGKTPSKNDFDNYSPPEIPFYKPACISDNMHASEANEYVSQRGAKVAPILEKNAILYNCIGDIGKCAIIREPGICNQQINAVEPYFPISPLLLLFFLRSEYMQKETVAKSSMTTIPILNKGKFEKILLPIPPRKEQERIAKELESLLQLTNQ